LTEQAKIKQLISKCKKQDWAAQKELYLLFADDMMSIAIRYARDIFLAKDLVQETFLIFFKKIDQYNEEKGTLRAWLSRILINKSFETFRKNKNLVFTKNEYFTEQISNEQTIIEELEASDILNLLSELPEGCRIIFNLKVVEGYSHVEIGEMLNISASASRSQLTRAKKLLRVLINKRSKTYRHSKVNKKSIQLKGL